MLSFVDNHSTSRRTAVFIDDGVLGYLVLTPQDSDWQPEHYLSDDTGVCWLYRRHPSLVVKDPITGTQHYEEHELQGLPPLAIKPDPEVEFLWSATGHSVCSVINGKPMGFIIDGEAYSKSLSLVGSRFEQNPWDETLFRATFKA